ncbi:MAG: aminoacyl-tRNA hydrolase [Proteobacteria bacterium]|nr:aminoacyl-tRNA hydrolase [Pseudomonadota bacterium]
MPIIVTPRITIEDSELSEIFTTSSGPGGQNVNKVATAVRLRFDALNSPGLSDEIKARLRSIAGRRMSKDGVIQIIAQRFASQERNRDDARERLLALIRDAAVRPAARVPTRVSKTQKAKRLDNKTHRARTKTLRGTIPDD